MIKNVLKIAVVIFLILAFCFPSIGQVSALDFNASESTGGMCVKFLNSFLTMIDSIITGEDRGTIEYSLYEIEEDLFLDDGLVDGGSNLTNLNISGKIYESKGMFLWPTPGRTNITSPFGPRWGKTHKGIDIGAPTGVTICASADGEVKYAAFNNGGYGNLVMIDHRKRVFNEIWSW